MSKRWLLRLVQEKYVSGWDDPRLPTIAGLRRRGYTPEAVRSFVSQAGISKTDSMVDAAFLEYCLREHLNKTSRRVMAVLRPLKLIIDNWPAGKVEELEAVNNPEDESAGKRKIPFSGELWIEREDFEENPPPKYFRLFPGNSVRLRYGYIVTCSRCDKDAAGSVTAVHCDYDPETRGGNAPDNKKVKSTIHWVSAAGALPLEVRLYDYLFAVDRPMELKAGEDFVDKLNPASLEIITNAYGEPCLAQAAPEERFQFERLGYFVRDAPVITEGVDNRGDKEGLVFNRTVGLRDTWAKIARKN
jgi:glutaminyl-tRNA synthetase